MSQVALRVLVAEPSAPINAALRKFLEGAADVQVVTSIDEAFAAAKARSPDVLITTTANGFEGEKLAKRVRTIASTVGLVLIYAPEDERAAERSAEAQADAMLVGPLKKQAVLGALKAVQRVRELRKRINELEVNVAQLKVALARPQASGPQVPAQGADDNFFKKYMLLEVKRSKRYQYPVALLMVGLDGLTNFMASQSSPDVQKAAIKAEVVAAIAELLRDVDVSLPFADDKFLVFLPHTPRQGCLIVADRLVKRLSQLQSFSGGTASVGVSSYDPKLTPKAQVSFAQMVKEGADTLKRAQAAGGNRVEAGDAPVPVKRDRISLG